MKIMMNAALDELTDEQRQRVQAVSEDNQIVVARTREEQLAETSDVDIIFGSFNRRLFDAAKQLTENFPFPFRSLPPRNNTPRPTLVGVPSLRPFSSGLFIVAASWSNKSPRWW